MPTSVNSCVHSQRFLQSDEGKIQKFVGCNELLLPLANNEDGVSCISDWYVYKLHMLNVDHLVDVKVQYRLL